MPIDRSEIEKIASLARLAIDEDSYINYRNDLSKILQLVDQLKTVDTAEIMPLMHPLEIKARLRKDEVTEIDQHSEFQKHNPWTKDGYYLVPKVIE